MSTKHTPGPWFYYVTPSGVRYKVHGPTVDYFICDVKGSNDLANARLIAAAPELLEALEKLADQAASNNDYDSDRGLQAAVEQARTIISKATGGTQ
jgi:hypothetical protein